MWSTAVGYAGGYTPNPTYEEVCSGRTGHAEVVLVVYDPAVVSYEQLLKAFWEDHDPSQGMRQGNDVGTQYRSVVYTVDDEQRAAAEATKASYGEALRAAGYGDITTEIVPLGDVLLRRAVPPAVPGQEPQRVLPAARHRRQLPRLTGPGGPLAHADVGSRVDGHARRCRAIALELPEVVEGEERRGRSWQVAARRSPGSASSARPTSAGSGRSRAGRPDRGRAVDDLGEKEAVLTAGHKGFFTIPHSTATPRVAHRARCRREAPATGGDHRRLGVGAPDALVAERRSLGDAAARA